jgi:hypothetical protein
MVGAMLMRAREAMVMAGGARTTNKGHTKRQRAREATVVAAAPRTRSRVVAAMVPAVAGAGLGLAARGRVISWGWRQP